ncbi:GNAT family N-acetyltransferase [Cytobacillus horneckiae]|uniref:GNAT family N-acetyltransferase n=1 Tax=Cytobacillus horneckiae TaxID=549687 RepID=UPI0034CD5F37
MLRQQKPQLESLNESDIERLIQLSTSVGWDYDYDEIKTIPSSGKVFGHKTENGEVVSSAAIIPYDTNIASIGLVIVKRNYRGMGLAKEVMQKCIHFANKSMPIILIATDEGQPLYKKLGFNNIASIKKYFCYQPLRSVIANEKYTLEAMKNENFTNVVHIDEQAFGAKRQTFLIHRMRQAKECIVLKEGDSVKGFGMAIACRDYLRLGPIIAPNTAAALLIIHRLAENHTGTIRIDVPAEQIEFTQAIESEGFEFVNQPPIMMMNGQSLSNRNGTLYSISAQIFG